MSRRKVGAYSQDSSVILLHVSPPLRKEPIHQRATLLLWGREWANA